MKDIIIIGGGISGLTAGIYAQKAGFKSILFEKNKYVGGLCTGWNREGYHIDGCIEWITGMHADSTLKIIWDEIEAFHSTKILDTPYISCTIFNNDKIFLFKDKLKLKEHLISISAVDESEIVELLYYCTLFGHFSPPVKKPVDLMCETEKLQFFNSFTELAPIQHKYKDISVDEYTCRFHNPGIRLALKSLLPHYYRAIDLFFVLGSFILGNSGKPEGGAEALALRIADRYKSLGGTIVLNSEVKEILFKENKANGVQLSNGKNYFSDYLVSACDTHITFHKLLQDRFKIEDIDYRYRNPKDYPLVSCVYIAYSVDANLSEYPHDINFNFDEAIIFEGEPLNHISLKHYCYNLNFAPKNKSVITVCLTADYEWWEDIFNNQDEYKAEKLHIANEVKNKITWRFPELKNLIKVLDIATPLTYKRWTGAHKGSFMSFGNTPNAAPLISNGKIEKINDLYLAGQWIIPPGGIPNAAMAGKWAIDRIINDSRRN